MPRSSRKRKDLTPISRGKRVAFTAVTVALFLGLAEVVLALLGVRPIVVERDPYVGFASELRLFEREGETGKMRTARNKLSLFNDQAFDRKKTPETFRIFTLGGSVTYGRPFDDSTSYSGWLRTYLKAAAPERQWQVINAGGISYASYRVAKLMEELIDYQPDLFIILSGHNEFLEKRTYGDIIDEPKAITRSKLLLQRSRLVALGRKVVERRPSRARRAYELEGEVEELLESSAGLNYYFRDDGFEEQVLDHYRFNLQRMIDLASSVGARVILASIPVNEKDFGPFKSQHSDELKADERARVAELVVEAADALAAGEGERAREAAAAAVSIDPLYAESHFQLGRALQSLGLFDEAATSFARAIEEDVCPLRALARTNQLVFEAASRGQAPLVDFRALLKQRMVETAGHANLGDELFLDHAHPTVEGNGVLARALVERMSEMGLVSLPADWAGPIDESVRAAVLARVDDEAQAKAYKNLSKVLIWAGKKREAEKYVRLAAEVLAEDWEVYYNAGSVQLERLDYGAAIGSLQEAVRLNPQASRAHDLLGVALAAASRLDEAAAAGERAVALDPQAAAAWNNLAISYSAKGSLDKAHEATRRALRLEPEFAEAHNTVGKIHFDRGELDAALDSFNRAISLRPGYLEARLNRGLVFGQLGRFAEALGAFEKILDLDSRIAPAHLARAKALFARDGGSSVAAIEALERAVDLDPRLIEAWMLLVTDLSASSQAERAAGALTRALAANPRAAALHHLAGRMSAQARDWDQAEASFNKAVELDSTLLQAWIDLGRLRTAQGRSAEAVALYRKALALRENDDGLHHILAASLVISGQVDEAREHLQRALEINPENAAVASDLARLNARRSPGG
ncbi:MAG: tetratricopeptide repeat protein [bacterium]|nr:tetratricopeptide repeat protein [bacterium]